VNLKVPSEIAVNLADHYLGQVTGQFYLGKETFAVGESVFPYFKMTNSGTETQNVHQADPSSFLSGFQIHVSTDASKLSTNRHARET